VFLDADDDLGTIRSKLEASSAEEIYLVIPRRSSVLRTPLEFRILARIANEMSSETILVTDDSSRRRLAHQEGFRTQRSLRSLKHLMLAPGQRAPLFSVPDWLPLPSLASLLTFLLLFVLPIAAVVAFYPSMQVTLVPQTTSLERTVDVTVDPDARTADTASGTLPATTLSEQVQVSESVLIPGDRTLGRDKARGEVVIVNQRSAPFTLPRGTTVRVDGGPKFVVDQERPLPPRVPVRVGVTAADAGSAGNVAAGQITQFEGNGLEQIDVSNQRPTTGGTDRQAKVVTEEDRKNLEDKLRQAARDRGFAQIQRQAGPEQTVPEPSVSITPAPNGFTFDQEIGAESDQLTGRLTAAVTATVFQNRAFNDLVNQVLEQSAGSDARLGAPARLEVPGVLRVDGKKVLLRVKATGVLESAIDPASITNALRGSSPQEARAYLGRISGLAEPPTIDIVPAWAPRAFRVDVSVRGPK
jgi:hypothetical protein